MRITHGFHATMTAQPGKGDALEQLLREAVETGPASDDDCLAFLIARSSSNPDVLTLTEGWTSKEAHDRVFATDQARALVDGFAAILATDAQYSDQVLVAGKLTAELGD